MMKTFIAVLAAVLAFATPSWGQSLSGASVTASGGGQTATLGAWFQGQTTSGANKGMGGTLLINLGSVAQSGVTGRTLGAQAADGANTAIQIDASGVFPQYIGRRANGTFSSPTTMASGDVLVAFSGRGHNGSAYTTGRVGIDFSAAEAWTGSAQGGKIVFKTTANGAATAAVVKMTLENSGALLVNTSTDNLADKLQVNGGARGNYLATGAGTLTLTTGAVGLSKMTASASAPGAAGGKIELVCGTNAGTAKLIAYAGTSGTAVTILDNIGAGVTGC